MDNKTNLIKELINGIGAICEIAGLMRDNLIRNGFTRKEACDIVGRYMSDIFINAGNNEKKDE